MAEQSANVRINDREKGAFTGPAKCPELLSICREVQIPPAATSPLDIDLGRNMMTCDSGDKMINECCGDTFTTSVSGSTLTVIRTDSNTPNAGWGQGAMRLKCCACTEVSMP